MNRLIILTCCIIILAACNNNKPIKQKSIEKVSVAVKDTIKNKFVNVKFDNTKDLSCGMPLTAGLEDTVHYKGKVYGFCSKECKADFVKNADVLLKQSLNK